MSPRAEKQKILTYIGLYGLIDKTIIRIVKKYQENEYIKHELTNFNKFVTFDQNGQKCRRSNFEFLAENLPN